MCHVRIPFAILLILTLLAACGDSTKPGTNLDDIRGEVVDAQGRPVAGKRDRIQTTVRFDLPATGPVTLWIGSTCDDDTVRMLVDGELDAGQYSIIWNGTVNWPTTRNGPR